MELQIAVEELSRALYRAQGIVEKKSTMPILANVLLEARKGGLSVTAYDMEIGLVSEHRAEVLKEGKVAVSARHIYDIVRTLPEPTMLLKRTQNSYLEIRCGASQFKIVGMPPEDFPSMPAASRIPFVKVKPAAILEMIEKTAFAVSHDETRFNLNGVFFDSREGTTRMVATDGHRLSVVERKLEGDFKLKRGVIIPRKGLQELKRLLSEGDDSEAELGFAETSGAFRKTGLTMIMRLIDGQFPDYQQVVPKTSERVVKVGRVRFLDTLRRVSLLSQDQMHTVKLEVGNGVVRVTSQSPDLGEAQEEIPVDAPSATIAVGFNARYLMDVLQALDCEDVTFELNDDMSPGVLRPAGDPSYTAVVMPVRI